MSAASTQEPLADAELLPALDDDALDDDDDEETEAEAEPPPEPPPQAASAPLANRPPPRRPSARRRDGVSPERITSRRLPSSLCAGALWSVISSLPG